eukprot:CAMPEP_0180638994 /NCGR_PEP_ID=MMETSP1037_2-20121125/44696_1 /TAXON_ID=632150 /ORGANISM="Azadinium spinosum, Strain 3D9" /LENGTH=130 /DNA_ID=CAMNT_0022660709 /DNA_START=1018 /DNA_END=1410 /DNA_ORIENTATION=-
MPALVGQFPRARKECPLHYRISGDNQRVVVTCGERPRSHSAHCEDAGIVSGRLLQESPLIALEELVGYCFAKLLDREGNLRHALWLGPHQRTSSMGTSRPPLASRWRYQGSSFAGLTCRQPKPEPEQKSG